MKNIHTFKGIVIGIVLSLVVSLFVMPGLAAGFSRQLTAYYNDIKLMVNGEIVTPKDAEGKTVDPFIIDGTTYLPVRAVAQALNQSVDWDGETKTVIIGSNGVYDQPTTRLNELEPTNGKFEMVKGDPVKDNLDKAYKHYVCGGSGATYALNGEYDRFTGSFIVRQNEEPYGCQRMRVILDGEEAYVSDAVVTGDLPIDFEIDVTGAQVMEIVIEFDMHYDSWNYIHAHVHDKFIPVQNAYSYDVAIVNPGLWAD